MALIAAGPPKAGTSALRRLLEEMGLPRVNGSLIYQKWHRHPDWVYEKGQEAIYEMTRDEQLDIRFHLKREEGLAQLKPGMFIHGHVPPFKTDHRFLVILRQPEANLISWYRAKRDRKIEITGKQAPEPIIKFRKWVEKGGCARAMRFIKPIYAPWDKLAQTDVDNSERLIVRYEELHLTETIDRIAAFVDKDPPPFDSWWGTSSKWTGRPSRPEEWFDPPTQKNFEYWWERAPSLRKI